jgi:hypothetical protein
VQVARETNAELLNLPDGWEAADPASILSTVASELQSAQELTRMAALTWLNTLLARSRSTVRITLPPWLGSHEGARLLVALLTSAAAELARCLTCWGSL